MTKHIGQSFDDYFKEQCFFNECNLQVIIECVVRQFDPATHKYYITLELEKILQMYDNDPMKKKMILKIIKKAYELECLKHDFIVMHMQGEE